MANENGTWIMHGLDWENPYRSRSYRELISWINEIGFLPLFKNEVEGFSAEEHVSPLYWWTGDKENDPWEWREIIARTEEVAYGKFFGRKSGFISKEWFSVFANYRRDGYDFDARWDDGLVNIRHKKIMDCFEQGEGAEELPGSSIESEEIREFTGLQLKRMNGFGKDGYKNFDGVITDLQMQTYLVIRDFRCKKNKRGQDYGMPVSIYCKPEALWGYEMVTAAYREDSKESRQKIFSHLKELFPDAADWDVERILR